MSLLDMLTQKIGDGGVDEISRTLGTDKQQTGAATGAALSTILGALARNSASGDGASSLDRALEKDHDGSILDNLGGLLGGREQGAGDGILKHVLGNRRPVVEQGLSQQTGLDASSVGKLMTMLAPVVMGALGRQKRQSSLGAGDLGGLLGGERQALEQRDPQSTGLIGRLLDSDGDGDVDLSDIAKHGSGLLGKLFKG